MVEEAPLFGASSKCMLNFVVDMEFRHKICLKVRDGYWRRILWKMANQ